MIELMIHRRLLADDDRGVQEALNETCFFLFFYNFLKNGEKV